MFCHNCGNQLKDGMKFCPKCGTQAKSAAPQANAAAAASSAQSAAPDTAAQAKRAKEQGDAYRRADEDERALRAYTEAIRLKPDYAEAFAGRSISYIELGNADSALADANKALQLDPNNAKAYLAYGMCVALDDDIDQGLVNINKSIQLDPNDAYAFASRGIIYKELEQYDQALKNYNKALELDPDNASLFDLRCVVYTIQEQYDKAMADNRKAFALKPADPTNYAHRGILHYLRGDYDDAVADYVKISQLDPAYYPENELPFLAELVEMGYTLPFEPQETEITAEIKCGKCGKSFVVSDMKELKAGYLTYECDGCHAKIDVSFFCVCSKCEHIVGFTTASLTSVFLDIAKKGVEGFLNPKKGIVGGIFSLVQRISDDVVDASGRGTCPICGQEHFRCPNCSTPTAIPPGSNMDSLVVVCADCVTKIRQG